MPAAGPGRRLGVADRTVFTGHTRQPEIILRQLDLFALGSDTEQMPISLLEAMAAALPVVATDVGDVTAVLPPAQHALVVDRAQEAGFAAALARLVADPALRERLGTANRAHVAAHFSKAAMVERYRDLLADSIAPPRAGSARPRPGERAATR